MPRHPARRLLTALVAPLALLGVVACGQGTPSGSDNASSPSSADDPRRIVALDDFAAVQALSLGVRPDYVLTAFRYETTKAVFDDLGIRTGPYGAELSVEKVLAERPDIVIGVSLPTTVDKEKQLAERADVTIVDYAGSWQDQLRETAAALGRQSQAAEVEQRVQAQVADLRADLRGNGLAGERISVIGDNEGLFSPPSDTVLGSVLTDVGLARPDAQRKANTPPFVTFSAEGLLDHDGDHVFVLDEAAYDGDGLARSPLWPRMQAVADDAVARVNGETWLGTSAFSVDWVLRDLRSVLVDGSAPATGADAAARFAQFTRAG
ncbi:MAG: ABC transporter substrate-binding protein [Dermatophilaceae bacterium]